MGIIRDAFNSLRKIDESFLKEDIEAVKRQYSHIPDEDFDKIIRLDPTFNGDRDSVGTYGKWLLGLYRKDNPLNREDITELLSMYDNYKTARDKKIEKDINKFKSIDDLQNALNTVEDVELTDRQKQRGSNDYEIVAEDDDWAIFKILSKAGAIKLGKGSGWCTADSRANYYDQYLESGGSYYVVMNKKDTSEKYQLHFETVQCFKSGNGGPEIEVDGTEFLKEHPVAYNYFKSLGYDVDEFDANRTIWELTREELSQALHISPDASQEYLCPYSTILDGDEDGYWNPIIYIFNAFYLGETSSLDYILDEVADMNEGILNFKFLDNVTILSGDLNMDEEVLVKLLIERIINDYGPEFELVHRFYHINDYIFLDENCEFRASDFKISPYNVVMDNCFHYYNDHIDYDYYSWGSMDDFLYSLEIDWELDDVTPGSIYVAGFYSGHYLTNIDEHPYKVLADAIDDFITEDMFKAAYYDFLQENKLEDKYIEFI